MEENNQTDVTTRITLKRHMWPDEMELKAEKNKNKRLRICMVFVGVAALILGWLLGSVMPVTGKKAQNLPIVHTLDSDEKIEEIRDIMANEWFFGKDIEDLETRLVDQASYGMTDNEEDLHTSYMSAEEVESFTQSINRNFVGIGVEFVSSNGINIVQKVFKNTPAEKAGVQPGDIIAKVDGTDCSGLDATAIKDLVTGEEGTVVSIEFTRQGETVKIDITRGPVSATVFGKVMDDNIAYLQLYQFGNDTADEVKNYFDDFKASGCTKLIIDLRDNGGGYLDSLNRIASLLLPKNTVVMKQVYRDDSVSELKTNGGQFTNFDQIVILINEGTASASEVLTCALSEQRDDVTTVGVKSYGKGSVQITRMFDDGSALKYTTSKWVSPHDVWVNGVGIEPDVEVLQHEVLTAVFTGMEEDEVYETDSVAGAVRDAQLCLDYLGYEPGRTDGYFSEQTEKALKAWQADHDMEETGILTDVLYKAVVSSVTLEHAENEAKDLQLQKAKEILNG